MSTHDSFFVGTNVFLRTGQCHVPDLRYFCEVSRRFLVEKAGKCYTSQLAFVEVDHQLRHYPYDYRGAREIRRRLSACVTLPEEDRHKLIGELERAYVEDGSLRGWRGGTDDNDRIHAAIASTFGIGYLVTWDAMFAAREDWIAQVNKRHGLDRLRFITPT